MKIVSIKLQIPIKSQLESIAMKLSLVRPIFNKLNKKHIEITKNRIIIIISKESTRGTNK